MELSYKIIKEIFRNKICVTLKNGTQVLGFITSQVHEEENQDKITGITVLESKPLGLPVRISASDIEKLEILDGPNTKEI